MKRRELVLGVAGAMISSAVTAAPVTTYNIAVLTDNSGPFADLGKKLAARTQVIQWWNENEGAKLGIKLDAKVYDTRYDPSVVASIWPGIVSGDKPILALGLGGPDVSALQERLPGDKIPVLYATPGYGYSWTENSWVFNIRPSYVQEYLAGLLWFIDNNPKKRPVKVAFISTQASPAFVDMVKGITKYIDEKLKPKGLAEVVATEWVQIQPVDLGSQIQRISGAGADIIFGLANTAMAGAVVRAQKLHGVVIPTMASPWHTIWPVAQAMKSYKPWEGNYTVTGIVSSTEKTGLAHDFYEKFSAKYKLDKEWDPLTLLGISQGIAAVKAIEVTAKRVGSDKLTGSAIYETLTTHKFTENEMEGFMRGLEFTKAAPFPLKGWVKVETVIDGKYQLADPKWVSVPEDIVKW